MTIEVWPLAGFGEVKPGDDIAALIAEHGRDDIRDHDVVVVTSKIVSKAAGLATTEAKPLLLARQTDRVVASRGETSIVRTHHGLTLAAAGIDNSNTEPGVLLPLPVDPDADARAIRERLAELLGVDVAVIISDTAGRAWRIGQTDIAIGCAGIEPSESFAGVEDSFGNVLAVTSPAIADQIAGAAELAAGKIDGNPVVVVRGLRPSWFMTEHGPGAASLIRDEDGDMFGLGAREAVVTAVTNDASAQRGFSAPSGDALATVAEAAQAGIDPKVAMLKTWRNNDGLHVEATGHHAEYTTWMAVGILAERVRILAIAHGLEPKISIDSPPAS